MEKDKALTRFIEIRKELLEFLNALPPEVMDGPKVEGEWTVKDVLGHLAAWEIACLIPLEHFAGDGPCDTQVIPHHLEWNDRQAASRRSLPLNAIQQELQETRQRILAAASCLSDQKWQQQVTMPWGEVGTVADMLGGLAYHENEHLKSIKSALGQRTFLKDQ